MTIATPALAVKQDFLTGMEWGAAQLRQVYRLAADVKTHPERYSTALKGRCVAMIFEKPSLRTRVTFEAGIATLGGSPIFLDHRDSRLGERESIRDVARNLERLVQGIIARTFEQAALEEIAEHARIPVINALSDRFHPCQTVSDFFTLEERFGGLKGLKLAYVGDGNNVCSSLLVVASRLGVNIRIATPEGYEPAADVVADARRAARESRAKIEVFRSPEEAVAGAQAVYTDVWTSMGDEEESSERERIFAAYQVNARLMSQAAPDAVFMHCLPAHRGLEVTDEVMDSEQSIVFDEAENRLYVQKAILLTLLA